MKTYKLTLPLRKVLIKPSCLYNFQNLFPRNPTKRFHCLIFVYLFKYILIIYIYCIYN